MNKETAERVTNDLKKEIKEKVAEAEKGNYSDNFDYGMIRGQLFMLWRLQIINGDELNKLMDDNRFAHLGRQEEQV